MKYTVKLKFKVKQFTGLRLLSKPPLLKNAALDRPIQILFYSIFIEQVFKKDITTELTQFERQNLLKMACNRSAEQTPQPNDSLPHQRAMMYSRYRLAVCQIPKAGSTFWRERVRVLLHGKFSIFYGKMKALNMWDKFTRAIFVRHPFYRLYSCYNDRLVGLSNGISNVIAKRVIQLSRRQNFDTYSGCFEDITFEDFVNMVVINIRNDPYGANVNPHWRPQYALCKPCQRTWDVIGHLETVETDIKYLERILKEKAINATIPVSQNREDYLSEKCRLFSLWHMNTFDEGHHKCNNPKILLTSKLKATWNKGYVKQFGFTLNNFKNIPVSKWHSKCMELVDMIDRDEYKKAKVKEISKKVAQKAISGLKDSTFKALVTVYRNDFDLFGYDPYQDFRTNE